MSNIGKKILMVYLPDTRNVEVSPYGLGNLKLGENVFTYSRVAGRDIERGGTCPGSTDECEDICYAKRIDGIVRMLYEGNGVADVPPIPEECTLLRIHVSGDFDSIDYVASWYRQLKARPDVRAWAYTRSWRVPALLAALEALRQLPNLQLFASMDPSTPDMPPAGWRRAWIWRTRHAGPWPQESRLIGVRTTDAPHQLVKPLDVTTHGDRRNQYLGIVHNQLVVPDGAASLVCPEETKLKVDCESCRYCFDGRRNDVTFLEH